MLGGEARLLADVLQVFLLQHDTRVGPHAGREFESKRARVYRAAFFLERSVSKHTGAMSRVLFFVSVFNVVINHSGVKESLNVFDH